MGKRRKITECTNVDILMEKVDSKWLFGFSSESEEVLNSIISLFQTNNYAASPDNLVTMSDDMNCEIWAAREKVSKRVLAACQILHEGAEIDSTDAVRKQIHPNTANWIVQSTYPTSKFSARRGVRIVNLGGKEELLKPLVREVEFQLSAKSTSPISYIAVRCDIEDYKRYKDFDFKPVALSEPEQSLRYKLLLLKSLQSDPGVRTPCQIFSAHFMRHVIYWLSSAYVDAPADVFAEILTTCAECYDNVCKTADFDSSMHKDDLPLFFTERAAAILQEVDIADIISVREHQDVIRCACLLYFGRYTAISRKGLNTSTLARLIEIGLQNNLTCVREKQLTDTENSQIRRFFRKIAAIIK